MMTPQVNYDEIIKQRREEIDELEETINRLYAEHKAIMYTGFSSWSEEIKAKLEGDPVADVSRIFLDSADNIERRIKELEQRKAAIWINDEIWNYLDYFGDRQSEVYLAFEDKFKFTNETRMQIIKTRRPSPVTYHPIPEVFNASVLEDVSEIGTSSFKTAEVKYNKWAIGSGGRLLVGYSPELNTLFIQNYQ